MNETILDLLRPRGYMEDRKTALLFWDGASPRLGLKKISYAKLRRLSYSFAWALKHIVGMAPGERIGIMIPAMPQIFIAYLGALAAGLRVVPLDPKYTPEKLCYVLNDAGAKVFVAFDGFYESIAKIKRKTGLERIILTTPAHALPVVKKGAYILDEVWKGLIDDGFAQLAKEKSKELCFSCLLRHAFLRSFSVKAEPDDIALILYTSGTTGNPKGVVMTHGALMENADACADLLTEHGLRTDEQEVFISFGPYFHILGIAAMLHTALKVRGKLVLVPDPTNIDSLLRAVGYNRGTGIIGTPRLYRTLAMALDDKNSSYDVSSLKLAISGSSKVSEETRQHFRLASGGVWIYEGYGSTEAGITHCQRPSSRGKKGVGPPLKGILHGLLNPDEHGIGEVLIKSPGMMKGYWDGQGGIDEVKTAQVFDSDGWHHTGDLGQFDADGKLIILGRVQDDFVKGPNNEKIYFDEIEEVLRAFSGVLEAAVVKEGEDKKGYERFTAYVVMEKKVAGDPRELLKKILEHCRVHLEEYKVPHRLTVVDKLPVTTLGKVKKGELRG